jgi:hypothetical protein
MSCFLMAALVAVGGPAAAEPAFQWVDQHDGGANFNDDGTCVIVDPDGHVVVAGESTEPTGGADLFVRKLHRDTGAEIWSFRYDGYDGKDVAVTEMLWDSVGQLIVAGFIRGCVG